MNNQQEMEARIKEVFSDKEYVMSLCKMETPEEVKESLAGKGIDLSVEEIVKIKDILVKKENEELSDDDLENVSGGSLVAGLIALGITSAVLFTGGATACAIATKW